MLKIKRIPVFFLIAFFGLLFTQDFLSSCGGNTPTGQILSAVLQIGSDDWKMPVDYNNAGKNATQADYYNFGWQSFIAANWPSDPTYRGKPDTTKRIGALDAQGNPLSVVWEAW